MLAHGVSRGYHDERNEPKPRQGRHILEGSRIVPHSYAKLAYHCIFSTKGRRNLITSAIQDRLYGYISGILKNNDGHLVKGGGTGNHVHLLVELKGTLAIADAIRVIKANSSKWVHETYPDQRNFGWQTGYAAFTTSASSIDRIVEYIENQQKHHQTTTFEEEFIEFLRRHNLPFDERYLWD
jgi:REP element-mobilizing transposase RayT